MSEKSMEEEAAVLAEKLDVDFRCFSDFTGSLPSFLPEILAFGRAVAERERGRIRAAALKLPRPWMDGGVSWPEWEAAFAVVVGCECPCHRDDSVTVLHASPCCARGAQNEKGSE